MLEDHFNLDYDRLAADYVLHRRVQPAVFKNLLVGSGVNRASRVLEVGCGTGNYITALQAQTSCQAWGVDPSEEMLACAAAGAKSIQFRQGCAEQLDFAPDSFDLVFSVDVIHHVAGRQMYYHNAYRILSSGGKVCTVTDSENIIRRREPMSLYFPETIAIELERYPRIAALRAMMETAGFDGHNELEVEFFYTLEDGAAYRNKAFSSLHLIPVDAFERGLHRMEADLAKGPIPCVSRYVMLWGEKR